MIHLENSETPSPGAARTVSAPAAPSAPRRGDAGHFTLRCDCQDRRYFFSIDGKSLWTEFEDLSAALAFIGRLIDRETPVSVCNDKGHVLIVVHIDPLHD